MTEITPNGNEHAAHNLALGVEGFYFSDLFDSEKLKELTERFYAEVAEKEPVLHGA